MAGADGGAVMVIEPVRPGLPHRVAFVLAALMGAGVGGLLVLGVKMVAGWWP